jgi:lipopolysaccharide export LptBFGC system permease protein LptF
MRYRASRFVGALTEATDVQRLRALDAINEQAQTLALADAASVMRLSLAHTEILDEATQLYLRDRDRESYQPPEERARIATLNELALPLMQLILDLRVRVQYLQERPPELAIA